MDDLLRLSIDADGVRGPIGARVPVPLSLRNVGGESLRLTHGVPLLEVVRVDDGEIMTHSDVWMSLAAEARLSPGEAVPLDAAVELRFGREVGVRRPWRPGDYRVTASVSIAVEGPDGQVTSQCRLTTAPARLVVDPR